MSHTRHPLDYCVHELFAEHVARNPNAAAIVQGPRAMTYAEVDARANRIAARLRERGVGPEVIVGFARGSVGADDLRHVGNSAGRRSVPAARPDLSGGAHGLHVGRLRGRDRLGTALDPG